MSDQKVYLVETTSTHRLVYAIKTAKPVNGNIQALVDAGELTELAQEWLGEKVIGIHESTVEQVLKKFDESTPELADQTLEVKLSFVNELDEPDLSDEVGIESAD